MDTIAGDMVVQEPREIIDAFQDARVNVTPLQHTAKKGTTLWAHKNKGKFVLDHYATRIAVNAGAQYGVITAPTEFWGGLCVVDVDVLDDATEAWVKESLPHTPLVVYTRRGRHYYFRAPNPKLKAQIQSLGPIGDDGKRHVDLKAGPGLVVGPGSHNVGKDWTYRANVVVTADLIRKLPVLPMAWIDAHVAKPATPPPSGSPSASSAATGGLEGLTFRTTTGTLAAVDFPMAWTDVFCPHHPDNKNTPHARAIRCDDGSIRVHCFVDQITQVYAPKDDEPDIDAMVDECLAPLWDERMFDVVADAVEPTAAETTPPDPVPTPPDLMEYARRACMQAKTWTAMFRSKWVDAGVQPPTGTGCARVHQLLKSNTGDRVLLSRPCNKLRCFYCGPRLLATKAAGFVEMPMMDGDVIVGRPMCERTVFWCQIPAANFAMWKRAFHRESKRVPSPITSDPLAYKGNVDIEMIYTQVGHSIDAKAVPHEAHGFIAFRGSTVTTIVSTLQVATRGGVNPTYLEFATPWLVSLLIRDAMLSTYTVAVDDWVGATVTGKVSTSETLSGDPDEIRKLSRPMTWKVEGRTIPPHEARHVLDRLGVPYKGRAATVPDDPDVEPKMGSLNMGQVDPAKEAELVESLKPATSSTMPDRVVVDGDLANMDDLVAETFEGVGNAQDELHRDGSPEARHQEHDAGREFGPSQLDHSVFEGRADAEQADEHVGSPMGVPVRHVGPG